TVLSLLFEEYAAGRIPGERFGDWAARKGTTRLRELYSGRDALLTGVHLKAPGSKLWRKEYAMNELLLVRSTLEEAKGRACFTCSFQAEDIVVLHLLRQVQPEIPVLFLDTGYHFSALLRYRDQLVKSWRINLVNVASRLSREQQETQFGALY